MCCVAIIFRLGKPAIFRKNNKSTRRSRACVINGMRRVNRQIDTIQYDNPRGIKLFSYNRRRIRVERGKKKNLRSIVIRLLH